MMAHGIDLIELQRIQRLMTKESFLRRVYTKGELSLLQDRSEQRQVELLAGRFAAKEAAYKALMSLIVENAKTTFTWQDFEILQNNQGAPILLFHHTAETWLTTCRITSRLVSLTHTKEHALASVILC